MTDDISNQDLLHQLQDLHVRPLAQVVTQTLVCLVKNKALSLDEARYSVANGAHIITATGYSKEAKEDATSMLQDMLGEVERAGGM